MAPLTDAERNVRDFHEALLADIRRWFRTDRDPDRWVTVEVLDVLDARSHVASDSTAALIRYLVRCDLPNLRAMYRVKPEHVRAVVIWQYEPDGAERLRAIAQDGPAPLAALSTEAHHAYSAAMLAGQHIDSSLAAGIPVRLGNPEHGDDRAAYDTIARAVQLVPRLAGALDRALAGNRWADDERVEVLVVRDPDDGTHVQTWRAGRLYEGAVQVVDPGAGWTHTQWQERIDTVAEEGDHLSDAFREATLEAYAEHRDSEHIL